jgi:predicted DNA-binding protein YlxM (UPF0122 family)
LVVEGFNQGKSKIEVSELYDISIKTIDEFIELGQNGFKKYEELLYLYENRVIPKHLDIFLNDFQTKSLFKSLKHAKLSKEELDHYYDLGKEGDEQFKDFYHDFFDVKINLLVDNILSKKSLKISLKNSYLSREEFEENKEYIEDINEINELHVPNIITLITNNYREQLVWFEFLDVNGYGPACQHLYLDEHIEADICPEFLNVATNIDSENEPEIDIAVY